MHFSISYVGHFSFAIWVLKPIKENNSSVMCGAKGFKSVKNILNSSFVISFNFSQQS